MSESWDAARRAFADAGHWFVRTVGVVGERWDTPALGEWDVRALVGHTSRAFLTVETYLDRPATTAELGSPADYFRGARGIASGPDVAARGRGAGEALGDNPAEAVAVIAERVVRLVDGAAENQLITTIIGGMRLGDYLPTRTFELVVHTADLAAALDEDLDVPPTAASQALRIVSELAVGDGRAGSLLLAATGRTGLPEGYSVL